jgi:hypothetical protein
MLDVWSQAMRRVRLLLKQLLLIVSDRFSLLHHIVIERAIVRIG